MRKTHAQKVGAGYLPRLKGSVLLYFGLSEGEGSISGFPYLSNTSIDNVFH
jgi:hypothetical protein